MHFFPFPLDRSFLIANCRNDYFFIIYCSDGFCRLTGYSRAEVVQRAATCDFLCGPLTSPHGVQILKESFVHGVEKHIEIFYYKKDGKFGLL